MWYINFALIGAIIGLLVGAWFNAERAVKYKQKYENTLKSKNFYKAKCKELSNELFKEYKNEKNNNV